MKPLIEVIHLSKCYDLFSQRDTYVALRDAIPNFIKSSLQFKKIRKKQFFALRNINLTINKGDVIGIIGANGAGKSTFLKILARITPPTYGKAILRGKVASLLEVGTGFHSELTGRENVFLNGTLLGMTRREIKQKFDDIVNFSGVEKFLDTPVKHYSTGMQLRLAFAVAAHINPDILLVDEILAVGDADFQRKTLARMHDISSEGRAIIFVSHNLSAITSLCNKAVLLESGRMVKIGNPATVVSSYLKKSGVMTMAKLPVNSFYANSFIRLLKISVSNSKGQFLKSFDITKPVNIEIYYQITKVNVWFTCHVFVTDILGTLLFQSPEDTNKDLSFIPKATGIYKSICTIPGNFLPEGLFLVRIVIAPSLEHVTEVIDVSNVVTFHVHDNLRGDSVRGKLATPLLGAVRPKLLWNRIKLSKDDRL